MAAAQVQEVKLQKSHWLGSEQGWPTGGNIHNICSTYAVDGIVKMCGTYLAKSSCTFSIGSRAT